MEHGFYNSKMGYWQTVGKPSIEMMDSYPKGTIEVPLKPSTLHTWDGSTWVDPTQEQLDAFESEMVRAMRDSILANEVDPIVTNPLIWGDMPKTKQKEWADYRRALLDVPTQVGFPNAVIWPTKP